MRADISIVLLCTVAPICSLPTTQSGSGFNSSANSNGVSVIRRDGADGFAGAWCRNEYSCSADYKITASDMTKLDDIIQAIPLSMTLTTKCKIIDCVGYLCAFPTISNIDFGQVQRGSRLVADYCSDQEFDNSHGCGMGSFYDEESEQPIDGGLRYAYVPAPENQPGGNPGAKWKC